MSELTGRIALVTGASRGIGFAISDCLASAGATVILNGRNEKGLNGATEKLLNSGSSVVAMPFDASDEMEVNNSIAQISARYGQLDILVNNAGILLDKDVFGTTVEEWTTVLNNNLTSAFLCSRSALRIMREKQNGGRIVMIGSTAGQRGAPAGVVAYSASKAGLIGLAQTLAFTAASFGVTVNVVSPGMIGTEMLKEGFGSRLEEAANRVPLGLGDPIDVAQAVLFLAGDSGRYITGTSLDVNGGLYHR